MTTIELAFTGLFAVMMISLLFWLVFSFRRIDYEFVREITASHAKALDRHSTELAILKKHLGIDIDWDNRKDGLVAWSYPSTTVTTERRLDA